MSLNSDQVDEIILQAKASPVFLEESEGFTCKKQDYKERLGRKKSGDFVWKREGDCSLLSEAKYTVMIAVRGEKSPGRLKTF